MIDMMDVVKHPYINYTVRVTEGDEFVRDFTSQSSLYLNLNSVEKEGKIKLLITDGLEFDKPR